MKAKYLLGQMSSFKFLFFGWLFASQKTGFSGFRYRFIPSLRYGTGYASPYNPCHCLKLKNSKLNLLIKPFIEYSKKEDDQKVQLAVVELVETTIFSVTVITYWTAT